MNAYEYALKVEKDGENYYRELASKSPYEGLKIVFNLLANEEAKHYAVIKKMRDNSEINVDDFDITLDTKNIFETLSSEKDSVNFNADEIKFYEEAIAREDDAQKFYLEKAEEMGSQNEKNVFIKLAKEESKHKVVLQNILDFIQEPKNFVESAEF